MTREDLAMFADVIYKRKEQRLDMRLTNAEQEFNRIFMWLMKMMEDEIEERYPPEGKICRQFVVTSDDERRVTINTWGRNEKYVSIPSMKRKEVYQVIAECVDFIGNIPGYEILNRFPKDKPNHIDEFMIVIKYNSSK